MAVVTFDVLLIGAGPASAESVVGQVALFVVVGVAVGVVLAVALIQALRRHWIPEQLLSLVGICTALVAFVVADRLVPEAGLLATPALGMVLANHRRVSTEQILHLEVGEATRQDSAQACFHGDQVPGPV